MKQETNQPSQRNYSIQALQRGMQAPPELIAAVSISGQDTRMPASPIGSSMAIQVVETAQRISQALGHSLV